MLTHCRPYHQPGTVYIFDVVMNNQVEYCFPKSMLCTQPVTPNNPSAYLFYELDLSSFTRHLPVPPHFPLVNYRGGVHDELAMLPTTSDTTAMTLAQGPRSRYNGVAHCPSPSDALALPQ